MPRFGGSGSPGLASADAVQGFDASPGHRFFPLGGNRILEIFIRRRCWACKEDHAALSTLTPIRDEARGSGLGVAGVADWASRTLSLRRQRRHELNVCAMAVLRHRRGLWGSELTSRRRPSKVGELGACPLRHQAFQKPSPRRRLLKGLVHQRTGTQLPRDRKQKRAAAPLLELRGSESKPDQGVELGCINVIELLHTLFDLVLVGLDVHNEHKCIVSSVFFMADGSQGEFDDGIAVKLVSPGCALPRIFRLPSEPQCLWLSEECGAIEQVFAIAAELRDFSTGTNNIQIDKTKPLWHNYFLCGFKGIQEHFGLSDLTGMNCLVDGTIPPSSGLSSSSALVCCAGLVTLTVLGMNLSKHLVLLPAASRGTDPVGGKEAVWALQTDTLCTVRSCSKIVSSSPTLNMHLVKSHPLQDGISHTQGAKEPHVARELQFADHGPRGPDRPFSQIALVKWHFIKMHGEKKHKCSKCSNSYALNGNWSHAEDGGSFSARVALPVPNCATVAHLRTGRRSLQNTGSTWKEEKMENCLHKQKLSNKTMTH
ncbi:LOW QUALITY PROTEIN: hypothetical protein QTO34_019713 [Cnephaeus nilssonii]|uniref:C2H2-type domain-containing protein n=1 Tax=Cnephaeus nilssonii TaxID=3371016 RepID=A0AA40HX78_CNENI|nr:LOW QUALITY PROTEIN: hypothetical protein QTO34_019713 [Eptesicus nilssonii]